MHEELIARLEAASEGSPELDCRIHAVLHPAQRVLTDPGSVGPQRREPKYGVLAEFPMDGWDDYEGVARSIGALAYTTLLDAALTLVKGWWWTVGPGKTRPDEPLYGAAIYEPVVGVPQLVASGEHDASPALALCIAALRLSPRSPGGGR